MIIHAEFLFLQTFPSSVWRNSFYLQDHSDLPWSCRCLSCYNADLSIKNYDENKNRFCRSFFCMQKYSSFSLLKLYRKKVGVNYKWKMGIVLKKEQKKIKKVQRKHRGKPCIFKAFMLKWKKLLWDKTENTQLYIELL